MSASGEPTMKPHISGTFTFDLTYGTCKTCQSTGHKVPEQLLSGECFLCALGPVDIVKGTVTLTVQEIL